jgi:hypothetical protein
MYGGPGMVVGHQVGRMANREVSAGIGGRDLVIRRDWGSCRSVKLARTDGEKEDVDRLRMALE